MKSLFLKNIHRYLLSLLAIVVIIGSICIQINQRDTNSEYKKQWALYNNGQKVNGVKGKKGIDINIQKTWKKTKGNPDITIAVIDTGCDYQNTNLNKLQINSWDFYHKDSSIYDNYYSDAHGTYICNIISGQHKKESYYGVAPDCTLLPIKALNGSKGKVSDIADAIKYAHKRGARIINCSFDYEDCNKEIYNLIKQYSDTLFVCAGGKNGIDISKNKIYPACYKLDNILCVGAINSMGEMYKASGYGPMIDLYAPGENIFVEVADGDTTFVDGTSASAAYVTGASALIYSLYPDLTPIQVKKELTNKCKLLNTTDNTENHVRLLDVDATLKSIRKRGNN